MINVAIWSHEFFWFDILETYTLLYKHRERFESGNYNNIV